VPAPHDERVLGTPAVPFHPNRQRHQPRVAGDQIYQTRPKFGTQIGRINVRSKDGLPVLPQRYQIVVRFASQAFEVNVLGERLSIQFSRKPGYTEANLVNPCWALGVAVNPGPKLADHPQPAGICGYMDIKTLDILVRALPPVL